MTIKREVDTCLATVSDQHRLTHMKHTVVESPIIQHYCSFSLKRGISICFAMDRRGEVRSPAMLNAAPVQSPKPPLLNCRRRLLAIDKNPPTTHGYVSEVVLSLISQKQTHAFKSASSASPDRQCFRSLTATLLPASIIP